MSVSLTPLVQRSAALYSSSDGRFLFVIGRYAVHLYESTGDVDADPLLSRRTLDEAVAAAEDLAERYPPASGYPNTGSALPTREERKDELLLRAYLGGRL